MENPRAHSGQPTDARTAQQVDEDGLGLIVGRVTEQYITGQRVVAGRTGPCFEVGPRDELDAFAPESRAEAIRGGRDDVRFGGGTIA